MTYLLKVDVISELHVLRVNAKNLKTARWIRNTNIYFSVEASEAAKSGINCVGSIRCSHNHYIRPCLKTIHEGEELRHNTTFNFAIGLEEIGISDQARRIAKLKAPFHVSER